MPFLTAGDAAPIEYATDADRPFTGADLVVETPSGERRVGFTHIDGRIDADQRELAVDFADPVTGLRATVHYRVPAGTDVVQRWVELTNDGTGPLRVVRAGSGGFCVPTPHGALLSHQWGQWEQEFQLSHVELGHGTFSIGSSQGVPGHLHVPWLAVRDTAAPAGAAWGWPWPGPARGRSAPNGTPAV
ncbi:glycoside hydrolase family 36 N-terminal domain-containing protein [Micromonospora sp. M12]